MTVTTKPTAAFDRFFFLPMVLLLLLGAVIVLDASYARAYQSFDDELYFFKRQLMWTGISLLALAAAMHFPYWHLRKLWPIALLGAIVLLVLVLIPGIGVEVNGARRWLRFGGVTLQPSEVAKVTLVLVLACYGDAFRRGIRSPVGFAVAVGITGLLTMLVAVEDLGTAITLAVTGMIMIFAMGARKRHLAVLLATAVAVGVALVVVKPYRMERVTGWLDLVFNPLKVHSGAAYQPAQGLIALGSGGITGNGIGAGYAKFLYLPAEHTDYIFATIGEEIGLVGCLVLLALFGGLVLRGLHIAFLTRDRFGSLLATGFTMLVGVQTALNIAVVTGLIPCTGVPLPFISYGGSSVLFTTIAMGVVLNISRYPGRAGVAERQHRKERPRARSTDGWRHRRPHLSRS